MTEKQLANLKPRDHFTREQQSNGAKRTNEIKRQKKALKEIFQKLLSMDVDLTAVSVDDIKEYALEVARDHGGKVSMYDAIALAQLNRAVQGDVQSATFVRDSAGDKPTDKVDVDNATTIKLIDD